jgi:hypothetical protein
MFVGHYGVSFAAKSIDKRVPLWTLFIAVQAVDILWGAFVLLGIEKMRIRPGLTAASPLDLYYMPYTHSLVGALAWSALGFAVYRLARGRGSAGGAVLVAAAVFSHWVLDLIVHRADLPLYGNAHKVGLGLWKHAAPALTLEMIVLWGGLVLYLHATTARAPGLGQYGMAAFGIVLALVQVVGVWGPTPSSPRAEATTALFFYFAFAGVAAWLEKSRT